MLKIQFGLTISSQVSKDWANDFIILISNIATANHHQKTKMCVDSKPHSMWIHRLCRFRSSTTCTKGSPLHLYENLNLNRVIAHSLVLRLSTLLLQNLLRQWPMYGKKRREKQRHTRSSRVQLNNSYSVPPLLLIYIPFYHHGRHSQTLAHVLLDLLWKIYSSRILNDVTFNLMLVSGLFTQNSTQKSNQRLQMQCTSNITAG